jgi:hypothetical protein
MTPSSDACWFPASMTLLGRANWWAQPGRCAGSTAASARVRQPPPAPPLRIPRQSSSR